MRAGDDGWEFVAVEGTCRAALLSVRAGWKGKEEKRRTVPDEFGIETAGAPVEDVAPDV